MGSGCVHVADSMKPVEKQFYLQSFRHRSFVIHVAHPYHAAHVRSLVDELIDNRTVVLTVAAKAPKTLDAVRLSAPRPDGIDDDLVEVGSRLLSHGAVWIRKPPALTGVRALDFSCRLAVRLGVHKLVVVDPRGGLHSESVHRSFIDGSTALRLAHSDVELGGWRVGEVERIVATVRSGVEAVNLTTAEQVEAELFTYEGSGTLVTADDYCRVSTLRADDFAQAFELLDRGEREGFLLARDAHARARLLLSGYGAWFEGRLAGIAGLETELYRRTRHAEVVGLYTITRFKGEGVGIRILDHLFGIAEGKGCRAVFACTSNERAAEFFLRNGFVRVPWRDIPSEKWKQRRRKKPMTFLRELRARA
jgi:N-acetylglutamate synthase-like GNAT family acetyltransferase